MVSCFELVLIHFAGKYTLEIVEFIINELDDCIVPFLIFLSRIFRLCLQSTIEKSDNQSQIKCPLCDCTLNDNEIKAVTKPEMFDQYRQTTTRTTTIDSRKSGK